MKATEFDTRGLGGALVKFGPGGEVLIVKPAAASAARLQICNVSCTWYKPSKFATLEFSSTQSMEEARHVLCNKRLLDRTLECRTAVNKKTKLWECYVKVGNLDLATTHKMLTDGCGHRRPYNVTFGENSYSSSAETIGEAIQRLLSSIGTVETWVLTSSTKSAQMKAIATFSTLEQATKAVNELNGHKIPQPGGSELLLSHSIRAKFSILSTMYTAISRELTLIQQRFWLNKYLEIKTYPSTDKAQRFTSVHIISNSAREVGKAKAAVEKLLNGHTARGAKEITWHEFFMKPEGTAYLNDLGKQHNIFIYRNHRKCILSLYGDEENKMIVESALLKTLDDLAGSTFNIDLDENVPEAAYQATYQRIVEKLGKSAARPNFKTCPKSITVHESSRDADWARSILLEQSGHSSALKSKFSKNNTCAICWCDVTEAYTTPCGHT